MRLKRINWRTAPLSALLLTLGLAGGIAAEDTDSMKNLIDFKDPATGEWRIVNDGVMGGLSQSRIERTGDGTGLFRGELSLENNGGFASARALLGRRDLSPHDGLEIRVRGDGRSYQLRIRTDDRWDGIAYRAIFQTTAGEWTTVRLPFSEFLPSFRGRILSDVPALDPSRVHQLVFMVADKTEGAFELEIEYARGFDSGSD